MTRNCVLHSIGSAKHCSVLYSRPLHKSQRGEQILPEQTLLEELLQRIKRSEESALASLYDATVNRIYALALRITTRPELAEEVVNDVYIQVWRQAKNYDKNKAVAIAWLMMLCRSRALDKLRQEKSAHTKTVNIASQDEHKEACSKKPSDMIYNEEISERVSMAMKCLSEVQRQTVALAFFRDMSQSEIADYTGLPLGTVKTNIRRAQAILRNALSAEGDEKYVNI